MPEKLYKVAEVAAMFDVTSYTVREWLKAGTLKGVKIGTGHFWRIPASEIDRLGTIKHGDNS